METETIRLQKYIAERGIASRRHSAQIVQDGRVQVNGRVETEPGVRIDPTADTVLLDGKPLSPATSPHITIMIHKPRGAICSRSSVQGKTVYALLPPGLHCLVPIGRLDKDSEGLLLLSNDGDTVNLLTHPSHGHSKTYQVTVSGGFGPPALEVLQSRLVIDGYRIQPVSVRWLRKTDDGRRDILEFTMKEGRNRQIRKMCDLAGLRVHRLMRTAVRKLSLDRLKPGQWRELTPTELENLRKD